MKDATTNKDKLARALDMTFAFVFAAAIVLACGVLLIQNFVLSEHFDLLSLREVDDFAFQASLRTMHKALMSGHGLIFISDNDYGYGAFFWLINALVTLPGYLLGIDQEIIVAPRLVSLAAGIGTLAMLWRIAALYTRNSALRLAIPLLMAMQPEFAFAALRFHTHALALLCCVTSFYLALTVEHEKSLWKPVLALALAVGIKINALILSPVIVGILWMRWAEIGRGKPLPVFCRLGLLGTLLAVFFYNPLLLFFPFFRADAFHAVRTLAAYAVQAGTNTGDPSDAAWSNMIMNGLFKNYGGWFTLPLLAATAVAGFMPLADKDARILRKQYALRVAAGGYAFAAVVLLFRVKQGPFAYANYLIAVAFIPLLALLLVDYLPARTRAVALAIFLAGFGWINRDNINEFYFRYQHAIESAATRDRLADRQELVRLMQPVSGRIRVLTDYRAVLPVSNFTPGVARDDFFDNFFVFHAGYDYIVLHRDNPSLWPPEKISASIGQPARTLESHDAMTRLIGQGQFQDQRFVKIFENERLIVFKEKVPG